MSVPFPAAQPPAPPAFRPLAPPPDAATGYQPQFDALRALAVLAVTSDHFAAGIPNFPVPDSVHLGAVAVRLFLILSGYFITASLGRTRDRLETTPATPAAPRRALGAFYLQRFLRIVPPYGLFLLAGLALDLGNMRRNATWIGTFTVNFLIARTGEWPLVISHLWSICVQEQFYVFWPLLILFLPRCRVFPAIMGVAVAGVAFRVGCVLGSVPLVARWVLPFGSLDALAGGAALAWSGWRPAAVRRDRPFWLPRVEAGLAGLALGLASILRNGDQTRLLSVLVEPLEILGLVWLVARTQAGWGGWTARVLRWPGLLYAGRISYGIYIYHILVAVCLDQWTPARCRWLVEIPVLRLLTLTLVTLTLAALSWQLVELPINRWRHGLRRNQRLPLPVPSR